jgi:hypothetical protein
MIVKPAKERSTGRTIMQHLRDLCRFLQQPLVNVLGMLGAAEAAKTGHGGLAAEGILTFVLVYMSAVVPPALAPKLALWVADATHRTSPIITQTTITTRAMTISA